MTANVDEAIGRNIRLRRISLGLTQGQLAEKLGVSHNIIPRYESGEVSIAAGRLWKISEALNAPIGELFEESGASQGESEAKEFVKAFEKLNQNTQRAILKFAVSNFEEVKTELSKSKTETKGP